MARRRPTSSLVRCTSGSGWRTVALVLLATVPYVVMAWWPFHWGPPRISRNHVAAVGDGYRFTPPSVLCRRLDGTWAGAELRLEILEEGRPGADSAVLLGVVDRLGRTVVELARDPGGWTLRRTGPVGKTDSLRAPVPSVAPSGTEVVVAFPGRRMQLAVDAATEPVEMELAAPLPWPDEAYLRLGAAAGGERAWAGVLRSATLRSADAREVDLLAGSALEVPDWLFALPPQLRRSLASGLFPLDSWPDVWLNLFGFVPLGYWLLHIAALRRLGTAIGIGFVTSLTMEVGQLVFVPRVFSLLDLLANTAGVALGSGCAWWLHRRGSRQRPAPGSPASTASVANFDARRDGG